MDTSEAASESVPQVVEAAQAAPPPTAASDATKAAAEDSRANQHGHTVLYWTEYMNYSVFV